MDDADRAASALSRLRTLVPPPDGAVAAPDWVAVERAVGSALPQDYRALVETYGSGAFDGFLWVLQPSTDNPNLDLVTQQQVRLEALRTLAASGEEMPYQVGAGAGQLLPWAVTDNGDVCFWLTEGSPDAWTVTVNEGRSPIWEPFDGSASQFLVAVLSRQHVCGVFPDDFPDGTHTFRTATRQP